MDDSFRKLKNDVNEGVICNPIFGASEVTFQLVSGVSKRVKVRLSSARDREGDGGDIDVVERLTVAIPRGTTVDGYEAGFVELPAVGMKLYRDAADDPWSQLPYVWDGEMDEEFQTKWVLIFTRTLLYGQGVGQ